MGRMREAVAEWTAALNQWKKLPPSEVNAEEFTTLERKLREAGSSSASSAGSSERRAP